MLCIYRVKKYGGIFCNVNKKRCTLSKLIACIIKDMSQLIKSKEVIK